MAPTSTKPSWIVEIERLGFKYTEEAQYDLSALSPKRRVQSREFDRDDHFAPKKEAERFSAQMASSTFPPIIATSDDWLVDGNTRTEARLIRKDGFHPAVVLNVEWATADDETKERLFALAMTVNSTNGRAPTAKERQAAVTNLIRLGWQNSQIVRALGVKPGTLPAARRRFQAVERLKRLDVPMDGITPLLNQLGNADVLALNDEPYRRLVRLAQDAGFKAAEVGEHAKAAKAKGSDEGALAYLATVREELAEQIISKDLTGSTKPPLARMLRQHLGFVVKYGETPEKVVERNPEFADAHLQYLRDALRVLPLVISEQEAMAA